MNVRVTHGYLALTEKEKQTLRLIVRGHDAKSIARSLDLSIHTINERLRDARRKLAVSSSREAARLLLDREGDAPQSLGAIKIGEAATAPDVKQDGVPQHGTGRAGRVAWITIGGVVMTLALGFLALFALPQVASLPAPTAAVQPSDGAVVAAASLWLVLVDQGRWDDSYRATGSAFRKRNTSQVWASVSERVRRPLGAMISRTLISQDDVPAPPNGYEVVKFRTRFANKADVVETVSLEQEDGVWRVVGVMIG
ncbi:MAG: DUF4019 domain-containing protein [Pseudomonadota bacterium]